MKALALILAVMLSGCSGLERWQESLRTSPPPTQAQIEQAMADAGGAGLPLPVVIVATWPDMAKVDSTQIAPLAGFHIAGTSAIVLAPTWNEHGDGEATLAHEAYNYMRSLNGLPPDDCGGYAVSLRVADEHGWYNTWHEVDAGRRLAGCAV